METNELNEKMIKLINESTFSYNSAKQIAQHFFKEARIRLISSILQEWQNAKLKEWPNLLQKWSDLLQEWPELKIEKRAEDMNGGPSESFFFKLNYCFDFGFEFMSNFSDLYYGIKVKEAEEFNYKKIEGWDISSPWWPAFNYIEEREVRYLGDNEHLCIDSKDYIFYVLDTALGKMIEIINNEQFTEFRKKVEELREKLDDMVITPFSKVISKGDETYLKGAKVGYDTFGISFLPRPIGFKTIIWEGENESNNHDPQKIADMLNAHPELKKEFSQLYKDDYHYWEHSGIIPFNSIIEWLNGLLNLLKSMQ